MMLRCDRLSASRCLYRKPLRSITNRLERGDKHVVRLNCQLYRILVGLADSDSLDHPPIPGGGVGVCTGPISEKKFQKR
jgi:hypothetical protein